MIESLKLGNVWVFVQLIQRGPKISCRKTQTLPNLRLSISFGHEAATAAEGGHYVALRGRRPVTKIRRGHRFRPFIMGYGKVVSCVQATFSEIGVVAASKMSWRGCWTFYARDSANFEKRCVQSLNQRPIVTSRKI